MLAVLQGGTLAQPVSQLTMYAYSLGTLVVVLWGLKKISEVSLQVCSHTRLDHKFDRVLIVNASKHS